MLGVDFDQKRHVVRLVDDEGEEETTLYGVFMVSFQSRPDGGELETGVFLFHNRDGTVSGTTTGWKI